MAKQRRMTRPTTNSSVSRRTFIQSAIAASVATGAAGVLSEKAALAAAAGRTAGLAVLSAEQGTVLTAVLNRLVPADGRMPGAGDVGITQFIDGVLADAPHLRRPILDVLADVYVAQPGGDAELDTVLQRIEGARPESFKALLDATYTGYYSHPDVLRAVGWVPPDKDMSAPEYLDASLLDDVRQRGPKYTNI